mmetsp:Transcript_141590/g.394674  ORF Transcript_141590/g.394674 Transcript_141590/m.394674 type:complete len:229 (+) Transcript_141590:1226-1912(+)
MNSCRETSPSPSLSQCLKRRSESSSAVPITKFLSTYIIRPLRSSVSTLPFTKIVASSCMLMPSSMSRHLPSSRILIRNSLGLIAPSPSLSRYEKSCSQTSRVTSRFRSLLRREKKFMRSWWPRGRFWLRPMVSSRVSKAWCTDTPPAACSSAGCCGAATAAAAGAPAAAESEAVSVSRSRASRCVLRRSFNIARRWVAKVSASKLSMRRDRSSLWPRHLRRPSGSQDT